MNARSIRSYQGRFIKGVDLPANEPLVATIEAVPLEDLGDEEKLVLYFKEESRGLPLNKTNHGLMIDFFGEETDDWIGEVIEMSRIKVAYQGKPCVGIQIAPGRSVPDDTPPF